MIDWLIDFVAGPVPPWEAEGAGGGQYLPRERGAGGEGQDQDGQSLINEIN